MLILYYAWLFHEAVPRYWACTGLAPDNINLVANPTHFSMNKRAVIYTDAHTKGTGLVFQRGKLGHVSTRK